MPVLVYWLVCESPPHEIISFLSRLGICRVYAVINLLPGQALLDLPGGSNKGAKANVPNSGSDEG